MLIQLCNDGERSGQFVGSSRGRVSVSYDRYSVLNSAPPFPFQGKCWNVRDFQFDKRFIVIKRPDAETMSCTCADYNENYKKHGDGTWASFGYARYSCEHIRAVALMESLNN